MSSQGAVLRGQGASPSQRMVAGCGGGVFNRPAIQQQTSLVTSNNGSPPLDDLALERVKLQLSSTKSVFLTPLNGRFASISVPKRRLSLSVDGHKIIIQNKKGATIAEYSGLDAAQFAKLVRFIMANFHKFQQIAVTAGSGAQDWVIVSELAAAVVESGPIDVRIFHLYNRCYHVNDSLSTLITAISSSLRQMKLASDRWMHQNWPAAIGGCQQLRTLDCRGLDGNRMAFGLLDILGTLPQLTSFRSVTGHRLFRGAPLPLKPIKGTLTLEPVSWLRDGHLGVLAAGNGDWTLKTFLQRIATVILFIGDLRLDYTEHQTAIDYIISSMHRPVPSPPSFNTASPPHLEIVETGAWCYRHANKPIATVVLVIFLRLASHHPVIITLRTDPPLPTCQQIEEAVNDTSIIGLIPSEHNHHEQPTFHFGNGSEFRLRSL